MTKAPILISVIIPIYNDELYLRDALRSIQQQTYTHFECICVNDGSTDKSEEIIDEFIKKDGRFVKMNQQNGGVSVARNAGLDAAQGEYVYMMDHDDLTPNYTLKKLLEAAENHNADLARGRMIMIEEDFKIEDLPKENLQAHKQYYFDNPLTHYYRHIRNKNKKWYFIWMCLYKTSVLKDIRFHDKLRAGGEDFLFTFDVVGKIKSFVQITDVVACHRRSKISVTQNGYNAPLFFNISKIVIPYIYEKYALDKNIDKRLLRWVYRKEAYAAYRFLVRNPIRVNEIIHLRSAREILLKMNGTPEFKEVFKRWNFRQQFFFKLFINGKYDLIKKLEIFM